MSNENRDSRSGYSTLPSDIFEKQIPYSETVDGRAFKAIHDAAYALRDLGIGLCIRIEFDPNDRQIEWPGAYVQTTYSTKGLEQLPEVPEWFGRQ